MVSYDWDHGYEDDWKGIAKQKSLSLHINCGHILSTLRMKSTLLNSEEKLKLLENRFNLSSVSGQHCKIRN